VPLLNPVFTIVWNINRILTSALFLSFFAGNLDAQSQWRSFANDTIPLSGWAQPYSPVRQSHSLLIDRIGNVWLSYGPYGLIRFDGQNWKSFDTSDGLLNDTINTMTLDTFGKAWFAGKGAIYKYDGTWHSYSISDSLRRFRNFQVIACDSSNTIWTASLSWIFTGRYIIGIPVDSLVAEVFTFDGSNWKPHNIPIPVLGGWQGVRSIACSKNSVWCVAQQPIDSSNNYFGGVYRFNGSGWDEFDLNTGVPGNYPRDPTDLCVDKKGIVWVTSNFVSTPNELFRGNIGSFDGIHWQQYRDTSLIYDDEFYSVTLDSLGRKWVGSQNGVMVIDDNGVSSITTKNGLSSNNAYTIAFGTDGNTWFGTSLGLEELIGVLSGVTTPSNLNIFQVHLSSDPVAKNADVIATLHDAMNVHMEIIDILGHVIFSEERMLSAGENRLPINSSVLPSGIYICRMQAGGEAVSIRFVKE